mgnify:CR=1 FL=1
MDEFKVIVVMNEAMLKLLKSKNLNYDENSKIKQYLEDEAFFFKIVKTKAYNILQCVGVKTDNLDSVYKKLIDINVYYSLVNKGKIKVDDENIIIKYKVYNPDDLFKKKNLK